MALEIKRLILLFREVIELHTELFDTMENITKNYSDKALIQNDILNFNFTVEELKQKYWIILTLCEKEYF